jgi:hypothetical protein
MPVRCTVLRATVTSAETGRSLLIPIPKAAKFKTIITRAKRYIPIASPIAACIAKMHTNQNKRVFLIQMKNG